MELEEIKLILAIEPGAPLATIISNEYKLFLFYLYDLNFVDSPSNDPNEILGKDKGVANLSFKNYLVYKFGNPNAEAIGSHPYYHLGLDYYKIYQLHNSDWLVDIESRNKIHPFHDSNLYKKINHYIIAFEDSTFECLAEAADLHFSPDISMNNALMSISNSLF